MTEYIATHWLAIYEDSDLDDGPIYRLLGSLEEALEALRFRLIAEFADRTDLEFSCETPEELAEAREDCDELENEILGMSLEQMHAFCERQQPREVSVTFRGLDLGAEMWL